MCMLCLWLHMFLIKLMMPYYQLLHQEQHGVLHQMFQMRLTLTTIEYVNYSNNSQPITINFRPGLSNQIRHHARFYRYLCQSINKIIQNINTH